MTSLINKLPGGRILASGIAALALTGLVSSVEAQQPKVEVVRGIPIASTDNCSQSDVLGIDYRGVSTIVKFGNRYVLASTDNIPGNFCNKVSSLIKSREKERGEIEIKGSYDNNGIFIIRELSAYGINLK